MYNPNGLKKGVERTRFHSLSDSQNESTTYTADLQYAHDWLRSLLGSHTGMCRRGTLSQADDDIHLSLSFFIRFLQYACNV